MTGESREPAPYDQQAGVDYHIQDPFKRQAQAAARETLHWLERVGYKEVPSTLGESAFIWEEPDRYAALVTEELGAKNLVAELMEQATGKTYYGQTAVDTAAAILNDLVASGADPIVLRMNLALGASSWFTTERVQALISGWKKVCDMTQVAWGFGETGVSQGVIAPTTAMLSGAAFGYVKPKERLVSSTKLCVGDNIVLIESGGVHANGISKAREIARALPSGLETRMPDGRMYGEALLEPSYLYVELVRDLMNQGIDVHYMINITGHGWRKLMRADRDFTYVIEHIPEPQPLFQFMQQRGRISSEEMYATFNMGAGYAIFVPPTEVSQVRAIASMQHGLANVRAGYVEAGTRQVVIRPKNIIYPGESLAIR